VQIAETKQAGGILIATNVTSHCIKKTARENQRIAGVMISMNRYGHRKNHNHDDNASLNH